MTAFDSDLTLISSATAVALERADGSIRGCLIRGRPGSGKSTLAIQVIAHGAKLISDDVVAIAAGPRGLVLKAPNPPYAGLIDLREAGVLSLRYLASAPLTFVVDLEPRPEHASGATRPAAPAATELLETKIPRYQLFFGPAAASAIYCLLDGGRPVDPDTI